MRYEGVIYFSGPLTRFAGKVDEREVVARFFSRWRWAARGMMLTAHSRLDAERCGYALLDNGVAVEQYDPPVRTT